MRQRWCAATATSWVTSLPQGIKQPPPPPDNMRGSRNRLSAVEAKNERCCCRLSPWHLLVCVVAEMNRRWTTGSPASLLLLLFLVWFADRGKRAKRPNARTRDAAGSITIFISKLIELVRMISKVSFCPLNYFRYVVYKCIIRTSSQAVSCTIWYHLVSILQYFSPGGILPLQSLEPILLLI